MARGVGTRGGTRVSGRRSWAELGKWDAVRRVVFRTGQLAHAAGEETCNACSCCVCSGFCRQSGDSTPWPWLA